VGHASLAHPQHHEGATDLDLYRTFSPSDVGMWSWQATTGVLRACFYPRCLLPSTLSKRPRCSKSCEASLVSTCPLPPSPHPSIHTFHPTRNLCQQVMSDPLTP